MMTMIKENKAVLNQRVMNKFHGRETVYVDQDGEVHSVYMRSNLQEIPEEDRTLYRGWYNEAFGTGATCAKISSIAREKEEDPLEVFSAALLIYHGCKEEYRIAAAYRDYSLWFYTGYKFWEEYDF